MAQITFKGNPIHTAGNLPKAGENAPDFTLTKDDLSDTSLQDFRGKRVVLNIFPSIDTPVCATSVRKFNEQASKLKNTAVLCISKDLPFAQKRFCASEGKNTGFSDAYKVKIVDGPLAGLFSRAIVVIDAQGKVIHAEQVPEIAQEPDYAKALSVLEA